MRVVEPALVAFLDANPTLDGHLTLPDLLFLERLAESSHRDALRESVSRAAGGADQGPADAPAESRADQPDRLDPVERIKIGLIREALRFPVFLEAIAGVLGDDALDPSSEHGGLVVLQSGEECPLRLLAIPSASAGDDNGYWLPPELFTAASLAIWHDHPFHDGEGAAGPSGAIGPSLVTVWGDRWIAYLRGIDGLVFTPTDGGGFSIVFFNAEGEAFELGRFAPP